VSDCPRIGKLFGGCKFSPRYDVVNDADPITAFFSNGQAQLQHRPGRKTYICDVCERCGKTLFKRKDAVKP
jgi:hypothetical protein